MSKVYMEFNPSGRHRLVVDDERSGWIPYEHPCRFKGYIALTQYYDDQERIYKVEEIGPAQPPISVCPVCGQPDGWDGQAGTFGPTFCAHQRARYSEFPVRDT